MKVVINKGIGGFGISEKAFERLIELGWSVEKFDSESEKETTADIIDYRDEEFLKCYCFKKNEYEPDLRSHPERIKVVEELGDEANGTYAELKIVEIPDDIKFGIGESDEGYEWVYEEHRTWS